MTPGYYATLCSQCLNGDWRFLLHPAAAMLQRTHDYGLIESGCARLEVGLLADLRRLLQALPHEICALPLHAELCPPEEQPPGKRSRIFQLRDTWILLSSEPLPALAWLLEHATRVSDEVLVETSLREFNAETTPAQSPEAARRRVPGAAGGLL